jgi:DNA polymerase-3 subunit epsilon
MPQEAFGVHGIGPDLLEPPQKPEKGQVTLRDKPVFAQFGQAFLDFVRDSRMVIHNASFDMKFLNAELDWMGLPKLPMEQALDTLAIARKRFPGSPATLDALCRRFQIDNSNRTLHGALLDSEILAEVYLELIGGRQPDFGLSTNASSGGQMVEDWRPAPRPSPLPPRLTAQEAEAHEAFVAKMGEGALWNQKPA